MFFQNKDGKLQETERYEVIRSDASNPLSSYAAYAFELDGAEWPTAEHYYQAMKFEDADYRERIRQAATPEQAAKVKEVTALIMEARTARQEAQNFSKVGKGGLVEELKSYPNRTTS